MDFVCVCVCVYVFVFCVFSAYVCVYVSVYALYKYNVNSKQTRITNSFNKE